MTKLATAQIPGNATRKVRLIDFPTGTSDLALEHKVWLDQMVTTLAAADEFWIDIYGFASKLGPRGAPDADAAANFNGTLSFRRAGEVAKYLEGKNRRVTTRIREFSAAGKSGL